MRQLCQCIYLIWTQCNQQCHHKHWYTYISHHWHSTPSKYAHYISYACPITPLLWSTYRLYVTAYKNKTSNLVALSSSVICICTMHLATIFICYHEWTLMFSLFGRRILFSFFMPITLEIVHTCVSCQWSFKLTASNILHSYAIFVLSHLLAHRYSLFRTHIYCSFFFFFLQIPMKFLLHCIKFYICQP